MRQLLLGQLLLGLLLLATACTTGHPGEHRQVVYFQEWSYQLDAPAQAAVDSSAAFVKQHPNGTVSVIGYADPEGTPQENMKLSRDRVQAVVTAMVTAGVPEARIRREAKGSTAFVQNSQESRRVEIVFGAR